MFLSLRLPSSWILAVMRPRTYRTAWTSLCVVSPRNITRFRSWLLMIGIKGGGDIGDAEDRASDRDSSGRAGEGAVVARSPAGARPAGGAAHAGQSGASRRTR